MRVIRSIVTGGAFATAACHHGSASARPLPALPHFIVERVPPNAIVGRVLDDSLRPVSGAQVGLDNRPAVFASLDGRFELSNVEPGAHRVRAVAIGHQPTVDNVTSVEGTGASVVLEMRRAMPPIQWVCAGVGQSAVIVRLLPVRMLSVPNAAATSYPRDARVLISFATQTDTIWPDSASLDPEGRLVARSNLEFAGKYRVEVGARGFVIWRKTDVKVGSHKCGIDPVTLDIRLERQDR
jgi:hypothetical protein